MKPVSHSLKLIAVLTAFSFLMAQDLPFAHAHETAFEYSPQGTPVPVVEVDAVLATPEENTPRYVPSGFASDDFSPLSPPTPPLPEDEDGNGKQDTTFVSATYRWFDSNNFGDALFDFHDPSPSNVETNRLDSGIPTSPVLSLDAPQRQDSTNTLPQPLPGILDPSISNEESVTQKSFGLQPAEATKDVLHSGTDDSSPADQKTNLFPALPALLHQHDDTSTDSGTLPMAAFKTSHKERNTATQSQGFLAITPIAPAVLPQEVEFLEQVSPGVYEATFDSFMRALLQNMFPAELRSRYADDKLMLVELAALKQRIYEELAGLYDFVVFLPTREVRVDTTYFERTVNNGLLGLGGPEKDDIAGIGAPFKDPELRQLNDDFLPVFEENFSQFMLAGSALGRQQGSVWLDLSEMNTQSAGTNRTTFNRFVLLQELAHRWGMYLTSQGVLGNNPLGLLGADSAHWSPFYHAGTSPMNGIGWRDNGNGTFTLTDVFGINLANPDPGCSFVCLPEFRNTYNDLDLYAMGLLSPAEVNGSFVIEHPQKLDGTPLTEESFLLLLQNSAFFQNPTIRGTRRNISVEDIIAIEGARSPAAGSDAAQRDFNIAFVTIKDGSESTAHMDFHRSKRRELAQNIAAWWSAATRGLSTMTLGPAAGAFEAFRDALLGLYDRIVEMIKTGKDETGQTVGPALEADLAAEVERAMETLEGLKPLENLIRRIDALLVSSSGSLTQQERDAYEQAKQTVAGLRSAIESAFGVAPNFDQLILNGRNQILNGIDGAQEDGILPVGFARASDATLENIETAYTDTIGALKTPNDLFDTEKDNLDALLKAIFAKLSTDQIPEVNGTAYDPSLHTLLEGEPRLSQELGNFEEGKLAAFGKFLQQSDQAYIFSYNVRSSKSSFVKNRIDFGETGGISGNRFVLGLKGPAGVKLQVTLTDKTGRQAKFILNLTGNFQNYELDLMAPHVPGDFDATALDFIEFLMTRDLAGSDRTKWRDVIEVRTAGLLLPPVITGDAYDETDLTVIEAERTVSVKGTNLNRIRPPAYTKLWQPTPWTHKFMYNLKSSRTAWVTSRIDFIPNAQALPFLFKIALKGPRGTAVRLDIVDRAGRIASFLLQLTGEFQNYSLYLGAGSNISPGFDRTQIDYLEFTIQRSYVTDVLKDMIEVRTRGSDLLPMVAGEPLDATAHQAFSQPPVITAEGANFIEGRPPGFTHLTVHAPNSYTFSYNVKGSKTAYVRNTIDFAADETLSETVVLGLKGPAGAYVRVDITDANGLTADFVLELTGAWQNYAMILAGENIPSGFDRTRIDFITLTIDRPLAGDIWKDAIDVLFGTGITNGGFEAGSLTGWETLGEVLLEPSDSTSPDDPHETFVDEDGNHYYRDYRDLSTFVNMGELDFLGTGNFHAAVTTNMWVDDVFAVAPSLIETFLNLAPGALAQLTPFTIVEGSAMKQSFFAEAGDTLSFKWNYFLNYPPEDPGSTSPSDLAFYTLQYGDHVTITKIADEYFQPFFSSSPHLESGTGYRELQIPITETGTYTLGFGAIDVEYEYGVSALYVDNIRLNKS